MNRKACIFLIIAGLISQTAKAAEPFIDINLSVSNIIAAIENNVPEEERTNQSFTAGINLAKSINLNQAHLLVYPDEKYQSLPVLLISGGDQNMIQTLLGDGGMLSPFLEKTGTSTYKIKSEMLEDQEEDLPLDQYRLWLMKSSIIFAPLSIAKEWKTTGEKPMSSKVAKVAGALRKDNTSIAIAISIPEKLEEDWNAAIEKNAALQLSEPGQAIGGVTANILSGLSESLKNLRTIGIGFGMVGKTGRSLTYIQQFRDEKVGSEAYQSWKSGEMLENADEFAAVLLNIAASEEMKTKAGYKNKQMSLQMSWEKENDEVIIEGLFGYFMGQIMAQAFGGGDASFSMSSNDGPIETKYIPTPKFATSIDVAAFKQKTSKDIGSRIFVGHYWENGDTPKMTMEIDSIDIPNKPLANVEYIATKATDPSGKDILRVEKKQSPSKMFMQPGFSSNISVPILKGTKKEMLGKAGIKFSIKVPIELAIIDFDIADPKGTKKTEKGVSVSLNGIKDNSGNVKFSGAEKVKLFAFDETGKAISQQSSSWSDNFCSSSFNGFIKTLKAVAVKKSETIEVNVEVDMRKGEQESIPNDPDDTIRTRYDDKPVPFYPECTKSDFAESKTEWESEKSDDLVLRIPTSSFKGTHNWNVFCFGANTPIARKGNAGSMSGKLYYSHHDEKDAPEIHAATGIIHLKVPNQIQIVEIKKSAPESSLKNGGSVKISFNKNHVKVDAKKGKILFAQAFDSKGKRLKGNYGMTGTEAFKNKYWGVPEKMILHIAQSEFEINIPFDLNKKPVDKKAYAAFKKEIASFPEMAKELKSINQSMGKLWRDKCDETLAGYHYLHNNDGNPVKIIEQAVAHSDPKGAERYGYKLTPYKGYHFTVAAGTIQNKKKKSYVNEKKDVERKWDQGTFTAKAMNDKPVLMAIPVDKSKATFVVTWNDVYFQHFDGETDGYIPSNMYRTDWQKISQ